MFSGTVYKIIPKELKKQILTATQRIHQKKLLSRQTTQITLADFDSLQKKQLRHEIIHAFLSESGLQCNWQHTEQFGHDETTVDWFAIQSPKIFKAFNELKLM